MTPVSLEIPRGRVLFNSLYDSKEPALLGQDLVCVELENGKFIDVGWYPQFDPTGHYKVALYGPSWEIEAAHKTKDVRKVVEIVKTLANASCPTPA